MLVRRLRFRIVVLPRAFLPLAVLLLDGCGIAVRAVTGPAAPPALTDLIDASINSASAAMNGPARELVNEASAAHPVGAFVGGGTGNKAILEIPGFDRLPIGALRTITAEAVRTVGIGPPT